MVWVGKRWSVKSVGQEEGRSGEVGVANVLSVSALGGDKMARTASHPSSRGVHDGSMCLPLPQPAGRGPTASLIVLRTQQWSLVAGVMALSQRGEADAET
jgi:hypothetical protein